MLTIGLLTICFLLITIKLVFDIFKDNLFAINHELNTLSAKDGDLRLSASNACLPKTEISVFVTECVFFTSTCYKIHMFTLHDVLYSYKEEMFLIILV